MGKGVIFRCEQCGTEDPCFVVSIGSTLKSVLNGDMCAAAGEAVWEEVPCSELTDMLEYAGLKPAGNVCDDDGR